MTFTQFVAAVYLGWLIAILVRIYCAIRDGKTQGHVREVERSNIGFWMLLGIFLAVAVLL